MLQIAQICFRKIRASYSRTDLTQIRSTHSTSIQMSNLCPFAHITYHKMTLIINSNSNINTVSSAPYLFFWIHPVPRTSWILVILLHEIVYSQILPFLFFFFDDYLKIYMIIYKCFTEFNTYKVTWVILNYHFAFVSRTLLFPFHISRKIYLPEQQLKTSRKSTLIQSG